MKESRVNNKNCSQNENVTNLETSYAQKYKHPVLHKHKHLPSLIYFVAIAYGLGVSSAFILPTNQIRSCLRRTDVEPFGNTFGLPTRPHNDRCYSTSFVLSSKSDLNNTTSPKSKNKHDEDEWNALLAAFHMYKAAYGDLKVPSRFVVPAMPPWPGKKNRNSIQLKLEFLF